MYILGCRVQVHLLAALHKPHTQNHSNNAGEPSRAVSILGPRTCAKLLTNHTVAKLRTNHTDLARETFRNFIIYSA